MLFLAGLTFTLTACVTSDRLCGGGPMSYDGPNREALSNACQEAGLTHGAPEHTTCIDKMYAHHTTCLSAFSYASSREHPDPTNEELLSIAIKLMKISQPPPRAIIHTNCTTTGQFTNCTSY